jgi:hypothetical protein
VFIGRVGKSNQPTTVKAMEYAAEKNNGKKTAGQPE